MIEKPYFLAVVGPTASGKSQLAVNIAKQCNARILSMDSMQIYKRMNVGTAKVTQEEMRGISHDMIDIVEPSENYSVGDYVTKVKELIHNYNERSILPILVGGTALYLRALIQNYGLGEVEADFRYRDSLYSMAESEQGKRDLYAMLQEIDSAAAKKLHPNDVRRVVRALEVFKMSGQRFSEQCDTENNSYDYCIIGLQDNRALLYERINQRVLKMFAQGLEQEVRDLLAEGLTFQNQSMRAIGYKEFEDYFSKKIDKEKLIYQIQLNSRHYAKRQITFFKSFSNLQWIDIQKDNIVENVLEIIKNSAIKEQIVWITNH